MMEGGYKNEFILANQALYVNINMCIYLYDIQTFVVRKWTNIQVYSES
jgi:hypothetical protein